MGLRRALLKWLTSGERGISESLDRPAGGAGYGNPGSPNGDLPRGVAGSDGDAATPADDPQADLRPRPFPGPAEHSRPPHREPTVGGLVVGHADHRLPPLELPRFYLPQPESPASPHVATLRPPVAPSYDRRAVRDAWQLVSDRADKLVRLFYADLFLRLGEDALRMFPSSMERQRHDFGLALVQWVVSDDPDAMAAHLEQLGADHRKFDVEPRHYEIARTAMINAWKGLAGAAWTQRHEAAIIGSYDRMASLMIDGALKQRHQPAWWGAQVVEHRRLLRDFAIVRIQPDAPYAYKPGQYLTLELPTHRRQWRQMSIASAPRADNTIDIHVRAVGAAGVSAALVMHTRPGDRLRLGPPRGNDLVIEPGTVPGGLLCVASGTGAAPITAVVESILGWPELPKQLYAYVGGRTRDDIYPVAQLNQLVLAGGNWPRVHVQGVVSDDPGYGGYRGKIENVVPTLQDWGRLGVDVLVAGPAPMMDTTITNLTAAGVPLERIHFDQYDTAA
jgi:NAD(P)H-flavin reductase/hemoglobin-like flavoprotein